MSEHADGQVTVTVEGAVATVTLNAPDRLNAVDTAMLDAVAERVAALDADARVRAIAITGAGRGFCAGANLAQDPAEDGGVDTSTLDAAGRAIRAIMGARTPTVAVVNGVAAGVGVSLALACSYSLASEKASFVLAFANIALMPDGGATALVAANIGRARALRMALTAEKVDGVSAGEWGLVAEVVPADGLEQRAQALLARLAALGPLGVAETVGAVNAATLDIDAALTREERGQAMLLASRDFLEGVTAFLDKRTPTFTGQ